MKRAAAAVGVAIVTAVAVVITWPSEEWQGPRLCVTAIDVGQGDSLLVQLPGGEDWLVDGGGTASGGEAVGRYRVLPLLRRAGVERLDKVFVTHGDADHVAGLLPVVEQLAVGELWIPTRYRMGTQLRAVVEAVERRGVPVRVVDEGASLASVAPTEALIVHPWPGWRDDAEEAGLSDNNRSLVLWLGLGRVSILLTGDVEEEAELRLARAGNIPRATVLKVPHHASRTSSGTALLDRVAPLVAVAGIGKDNAFGFPHASVTRRYLQRGTPLYWTGRDGHLQACTDGWTLRLRAGDDRGGWRSLRSWDMTAVDTWWQAGRSELPGAAEVVPITPRTSRDRPGRAERSRRTRARTRRKRSRRKPPETAEEPAPEPVAPPPLLDDRDWERRRRKRTRLRAPW